MAKATRVIIDLPPASYAILEQAARDNGINAPSAGSLILQAALVRRRPGRVTKWHLRRRPQAMPQRLTVPRLQARCRLLGRPKALKRDSLHSSATSGSVPSGKRGHVALTAVDAGVIAVNTGPGVARGVVSATITMATGCREQEQSPTQTSTWRQVVRTKSTLFVMFTALILSGCIGGSERKLVMTGTVHDKSHSVEEVGGVFKSGSFGASRSDRQ